MVTLCESDILKIVLNCFNNHTDSFKLLTKYKL
jgi:hypothetical protein